MDDQERKLTISSLRALVISNGGNLSLKSLYVDYEAVEGENIPYRKMGFSTLEELIRSLKDDFTLESKGGVLTVFSKKTDSVAHLQEFIKGQKPKNKKGASSKARGKYGFTSSQSSFKSNRHSVPLRNRTNQRSSSFKDHSNEKRPPKGRYIDRDRPPSKPKNYGDQPSYSSRKRSPSPPVKNKSPTKPEKSFSKAPPTRKRSPSPPPRRKSPVREKTKSQPPTNGSWKPQPPLAEPPKTTVGKRLIGPGPNQAVVKGFERQQQINMSSSLQVTIPNEYYKYPTLPVPQQTESAYILPDDVPGMSELFPETCSEIVYVQPQIPLMHAPYMNLIPSKLPPPPTVPNLISHPMMLPGQVYSNPNIVPKPVLSNSTLPSPVLSLPSQDLSISCTPSPPINDQSSCSSPHVYEEPAGLSPEGRLAYLSKYLFNEEPRFNVKEMKSGFYYATVQAGDHPVISTVAELKDLKTRAEARDHVIQLSLKEFDKLKNERMAKSTKKTTDKLNNLIIDRIYSFARDAGHGGLLASRVDDLYLKKYGEKLPENWTNLPEIKKSPKLMIEFNTFNNIVYASVATYQASAPLPHLVLPAKSQWSVFVTMMNSISSVFVYLIEDGYDSFMNMLDELETFMKVEKPDPVSSVVVGDYYCILDENWMRVRVEEKKSFPEGERYKCKLIDHGEESFCELNELYPLCDQFRNIPPQAFELILTESEPFEELFNDYDEVMDKIVGKTLVAQVEDSNSKMVTLYDTNDYPPLNLNHYIFDQICKLFNVSALSEDAMYKDKVYVSYICQEENCVFVQVESLMFQYLSIKIETLNSEDLTMFQVASVSDLRKDEIFLARYHLDGLLYRARVLDVNPISKLITVLFIDFGNKEVVKENYLLKLFETNEAHLCLIPPQAFKVQLYGVPKFTPEIQKILKVHLTGDEPVILKMISGEVQIHKRNSNGKIVNINNLVTGNYSLSSPKSAKANLKQLEYDPSPLESPNIPPVGHLIDVIVDTVSNPSNFWIQPTKDYNELVDLQDAMEDFYSKNCKTIPPVKAEDIQLGATFAFYQQDKDMWQRVTINSKISSDLVALFLVDFGEIVTTETSALYYLRSEFRNLPAVAIKSKLHDICPSFGDWSPEDMIRLKELCPEQKTFKCKIEDSTPDLINHRYDAHISIRLFDTYDPIRDIDIGNQLIEEGRAKLKE